MESLSRQVLEANEKHKVALDRYTRKLLTELDAVNKLISAVENISNDNLQDDPGDKWCLHADGALKPSGIIDHAQFLDERSPFFAEALRRKRYTKCLVADPFNASEKRSLEKAIMKENKRLAALHAQQKGQDAFEAVLRLDNEGFLHGVDGVNWENVARDVSASTNLGSRSSQECKVRWLGSQHPKINVQRWSEDEEKRLHDLVESKRESGQLDWEEISTLLETNRTALDCIKHFKASTQLPFRWTNILDNKLRDAIERYGSNNWVLVASSVSQHVSANQCQIRYERSLNPEIKRGKFTAEEDELLMKAIEVYGTDWVKVAQAVPGRTNAQCRGRYTLNMGGGNIKEPWDAENDARLLAAVSKHGQQWDKVRLEMGETRPQKQCASRYRILTRLDTEDKQIQDVPGHVLASFQSVWRPHLGGSTEPADSSQTRIVHTGAGSPTELPNTSRSGPIINGEEGTNLIPEAVTTDDGPNTASKETGSKRGRKRKAPPSTPELTADSGLNAVPKRTVAKRGHKRKVSSSAPEPDGQADGSRAKPRPRLQPTGTTAVPSDSDVNNDVHAISQHMKNLISELAPSEENIGLSQMSSSVPEPRPESSVDNSTAAELSDLTDLEAEPPAEKQGNAKQTPPEAKQRARPTSNTTLELTSRHIMTTRASKRRKEA